MLRAALSRGGRRGLSSRAADFTEVPIVDVSALTAAGGSDDDKARAAGAIDDALRRVGFMYVVGHGVDEDLCDDVVLASREFFAKEKCVKNRISIKHQDPPVRGWQRIADNVTGGKPDWHEAIDFYRELPQGHRLLKMNDALLHSSNQWPAQPPRFRTLFETYVERMLKLGGSIMEGIARASKLPPDYFSKYYDESFWVLRTIYYHATDEIHHLKKDGEFGCGEHTDYGCLTFVNCDEVTGALQVKNRQGVWVAADPVPGAFIVNVGDMLNHWTNGAYKSTPHRVNNVGGCGRVSVPFFFEPNYDARIKPLEAFGAKDGFEVTFGEHLSKRVLSNFRYSPNVATDNMSRGIGG
ncbi:Fe2OG dioxygenase domain-containing protein [Plasmodiophora brassicae]|uniref:Fe2OG dioxygenase domain-containing protein n=1 Tax=Plasmodiophora brassicae TaxID=37360 RepID=A0A0G4IUP7_PLABS|nr:hypothetical protein PBRA_007182 [Plasmodiophora brassicae]